MSIIEDTKQLSDKFGLQEYIRQLSPGNRKKYLEFRMNLLSEEFYEGRTALKYAECDEFVDAMIDISVIALGTLQHFGVDIETAWRRVHEANMSKQKGDKPGRNNGGMPDLMKPEGWIAPEHKDNIGELHATFE